MVEGHGIAYHEKTLGQQFCDTSSRAIVDMLLAECGEAGVEILCGCAVREISRSHEFELATNAGTMRATSLVVATGGLSFPKLGATDFGYRAARQFGLRITELRPGLVPLTLGEEDRSRFGSLSGVSLPVSVSAGGTTFSEALLFTHRGLSGPAILQASSYWQPGEPLHIDLLPGRELAGKSPAGIAAELGRHWPRRLVETWYHPPAKSHFTDRELLELSRQIHGWPPAVNGTEGYARAEVTLGGVDVGGLSSKTMEARDVRGLFFIGEVVDVTGWLGGYNFQWAWASGHAAGLAA